MIRFAAVTHPLRLFVISMLGVKWPLDFTETESGLLQANLSALPAGVYLVLIYEEYSWKAVKLTKY